MRDIKFRCWCENNKEWEKDLVFINSKGKLFQYTTRGLIELRKDTHFINIPTGIKDINGKEIYEGDIVSFYNDEEYLLEPGIAKIDFDCGGFMITNKYLGTEFLGDTDIDEMCIKVIGNIYENPELLKVDE